MQVNTHICIYTQLVFLWELKASGSLKVHSLLLTACITVKRRCSTGEAEMSKNIPLQPCCWTCQGGCQLGNGLSLRCPSSLSKQKRSLLFSMKTASQGCDTVSLEYLNIGILLWKRLFESLSQVEMIFFGGGLFVCPHRTV